MAANLDGATFIHVDNAGANFPAGFVKIVIVVHPKRRDSAIESNTLIGFVEPIGAYHVLHIPVTTSSEDDLQDDSIREKWDESKVTGYLLSLLTISEDQVEETFLNEDFIEKSIELGMIDGTIKNPDRKEGNETVESKNKEIKVTASTKKLHEFFEKNVAGELKSENKIVYQRVEF